VTHERDIAQRAHRIVTIHDGRIDSDLPSAEPQPASQPARSG